MDSFSLILASSSPTRQSLLSRFGLPFSSVSPNIDESALANESAHDLAQRLAHQKASVVAQQHPTAWVIGSDQVAALDRLQLGKPHTVENAIAQLQACRGRSVQFQTALTLMNLAQHHDVTTVVPFEVIFRDLTDDEIRRYVERELPLGCAGSFKMEGLGIGLFKALRGDDPTALMGLPLIELANRLREIGVQVP